jgi:endonuclease/exonuclease/phosphatase family metal-dependent hydrolase
LIDELSIQESARCTSNNPPSSFKVRDIFKHEKGNIRLEAKHSPFSIITYNLGLLVAPAPYLGTDRAGAVAEVIQRIRDTKPDVVGLCEVFANGERERIYTELSDIYGTNFREGPDKSDLLSDGGLLILSKNPILKDNKIIYSKAIAGDSLAHKGAIHIRTQPTGSPHRWDIFFTHTQDIDPGNDGSFEGKDALYSQLTELANMVEAKRDPNAPAIIMGDINIPAEVRAHYDSMIYSFDSKGLVSDIWKTKYSDSGFTYSMDNNFYDDVDDTPKHSSRLDYFLLKPGITFFPALRDVEILKWIHNGRYISDHFGLQAKFEKGLLVESS